MPCYDSRDHECREIIRTIENPETKAKLEETRERLNVATRSLCFVLGELKLAKTFKNLPEPIKNWSIEHDTTDELRVRERLRVLIQEGENSPFMLANTLLLAATKVHPVSHYHADWFYGLAQDELGKLTEKGTAL